MSKKPTPTEPGRKPATPAKAAAVDSGKHAPRITNRRAHFDYFILDKIEAGLELVGSEVKSVRAGKVQLAQAFARIRNGQVHLLGCHIDEYEEANRWNHDPTRTRRLLLHKREIRRLEQRLKKEGDTKGGVTLIPLEIYFKRGFAKVLLGVAKGKAQFDKRAAIKDREAKQALSQALRRRR